MMNVSFGCKRGNKYTWLVPSLLILLVLLLFALPLTQRLTISTREGKLLLALPVETGEAFSIWYMHSANRSPVVDTLEWTGNEIMVRETYFKTFGAGIPIPADGIGEELIKVEGGYKLVGINKPQQSFLLMTEEIPDHHLLYRETSIGLNALNGIGCMLKFEVKRVTLAQALRCRL